MRKALALLLLCFASLAHATVAVTAKLLDGSGHPVRISFLQFDLSHCGFNVPDVPSATSSIVQKSFKLRAGVDGTVTGSVYGHDEIACGNSFSTLWHVTAFSDSNTKIAGDYDYDLEASLGHWELSNAQPYVGALPPPGFQTIFANPTQNQRINQPNGTKISVLGAIDFTAATITDLHALGIIDFHSASVTVPQSTGHGAPHITCTIPGQSYFDVDAAQGQEDWKCVGGGWYHRVGNAGGDVTSTPTGSQFINEPPGFSFGTNVFNQVREVTPSSFNWVRVPTGSPALTASVVPSPIPITSCPLGLSTNDHYVWITGGTGTSEFVKITAFSCVPGSNGTITIAAPANNHSGAWTIGSDDGGLKEAIEDAKFQQANPADTTPRRGFIRIAPQTVLSGFGPTYLRSTGQTIDFQGAVLECYTVDPVKCFKVGSDGVNNDRDNRILNLVLRAMVPGAGGFATNAHRTQLVNESLRVPLAGGYWKYINEVDNDQSFTLDGASTLSSAPYGNCATSANCSAFLYGPGGVSNSGIAWISHLDLTLDCTLNGIIWKNKNDLVVRDSVIQNAAQIGIFSQSSSANVFSSVIEGDHLENIGCGNPLGTGGTGVVGQNGNTKIVGSSIQGKVPTFGTGSNTGRLYVVAHSTSPAGVSAPFFFGLEHNDGSTSYAASFPVFGQDTATTYDILLITDAGVSPSPYTAIMIGGSPTADGAIVTAQAQSTICSSDGKCTITINPATNTSAYTVAAETYSPTMTLWPAKMVNSTNIDSNSSTQVYPKFMVDYYEGDSVLGGFVNTWGAKRIGMVSETCGSPNLTYSQAWINCKSYIESVEGAFVVRLARVGLNNIKPVYQAYVPSGDAQISGDIYGFHDSNLAKTMATGGYRGPADLNDGAAGWAGSTIGLFFRDQNAISLCFGLLCTTNSDYTFRFTPNDFLAKKPIDFQSGISYAFSGPEQSTPGVVPGPTFQDGYFKAGSGFCTLDHAGIERCSGSSTGYSTVRDDGTPLVQRSTLNMIGAGVTCVDNASQTQCTIPGTTGGLPDPVANGFIAETASGNTAARTFAAGSARITISNPGGVAGNPSFDVIESAIDANNLANGVSPTTANTFNNKTEDVEGTGNVFTMPIWIVLPAAGCSATTPASAFDLPTTSAAVADCLGTTNTTGVLDYADGSTTGATVHFTTPSDWDTSKNLDITVYYTGDTGSTSNIRWQVTTSCVADGQDTLAPSYNTPSAANSAGPSTPGLRKSSAFTNVDKTNCSAGETMWIKAERVGADAGDVYTGVGQLIELGIKLRRTM